MEEAEVAVTRRYYRSGESEYYINRQSVRLKDVSELFMAAAKALDDKKGQEISAIEITDLTTIADYFVIATGTSNTQINALCGAVEKALDELDEHAL